MIDRGGIIFTQTKILHSSLFNPQNSSLFTLHTSILILECPHFIFTLFHLLHSAGSSAISSFHLHFVSSASLLETLHSTSGERNDFAPILNHTQHQFPISRHQESSRVKHQESLCIKVSTCPHSLNSSHYFTEQQQHEYKRREQEEHHDSEKRKTIKENKSSKEKENSPRRGRENFILHHQQNRRINNVQTSSSQAADVARRRMIASPSTS